MDVLITGGNGLFGSHLSARYIFSQIYCHNARAIPRAKIVKSFSLYIS